MKYTPTYTFLLAISLIACQPTNHPKGHSPTNDESTASARPILTNQLTSFQGQTGTYPILDKAYQAVNDDIAKLVESLEEFNKQFDKDSISGVHSLNYSMLNHDDKLAIIINYSISDMTSRYFQKYYQLDLKNKQQILLNEYLSNNQINIAKINENLNQFLDNCRDENTKSEQCNDMSLYYLSFGGTDNPDIDILEHHTGFYILDKDHIVIGFDSAKFTTSFKVNIRTYWVEIN